MADLGNLDDVGKNLENLDDDGRKEASDIEEGEIRDFEDEVGGGGDSEKSHGLVGVDGNRVLSGDVDGNGIENGETLAEVDKKNKSDDGKSKGDLESERATSSSSSSAEHEDEEEEDVNIEVQENAAANHGEDEVGGGSDSENSNGLMGIEGSWWNTNGETMTIIFHEEENGLNGDDGESGSPRNHEDDYEDQEEEDLDRDKIEIRDFEVEDMASRSDDEQSNGLVGIDGNGIENREALPVVDTENKEELSMEEGGIRDFEDEDQVAGGSSATGPIRSRNEIKDLPPVPPVNVTLQPHHQTLPVGVDSSGPELLWKGWRLNEGSIPRITESRSPLGIVDEVPSDIQQGSLISSVPEFADYVLINEDLYKKRYDASGEHDEELLKEFELSDDEKEAEYYNMQKMLKKETDEQNSRNVKNDKKKRKKRKIKGGKKKNKNQNPSPSTQVPQYTIQQPSNQVSSFRPQGPVHDFLSWPSSSGPQGDAQVFPSEPRLIPTSLTTRPQQYTIQQPPNQARFSGPQGPIHDFPGWLSSSLHHGFQGFPGGPGLTPTFQPSPQPVYFSAFAPSGLMTNGTPFVHPQGWDMSFSNEIPANMLQMQQNYPTQRFQVPLTSRIPFPQQLYPGQMKPPNLVLQGQPNFFLSPAFAPWSANMGQNVFHQQQFGRGFHSPVAPPPLIYAQQQEVFPGGLQVESSSGMRPPFTSFGGHNSGNSREDGNSYRGDCFRGGR